MRAAAFAVSQEAVMTSKVCILFHYHPALPQRAFGHRHINHEGVLGTAAFPLITWLNSCSSLLSFQPFVPGEQREYPCSHVQHHYVPSTNRRALCSTSTFFDICAEPRRMDFQTVTVASNFLKIRLHFLIKTDTNLWLNNSHSTLKGQISFPSNLVSFDQQCCARRRVLRKDKSL